MGKYTTEIRFLCETFAGLNESVGYTQTNEIIQKAIPKIFNFDFPIFDESYRNVLCTKILKHYYTREIGLETFGLWQLKLDTKLNEIMPYYNELYKTELFEFNPLYDTDYTRTHLLNKSGNDDTTGQSTDTNITNSTDKRTDNLKDVETDKRQIKNEGTNSNLQKYTDTPQGSVTDFLNGKYLTNATEDNGSNSNTEVHSGNVENTKTGTVDNVHNSTVDNVNKSNINKTYNSTDEYIENVKGKMNSSKSYSQIVQEFRQTILNIDMMIIDELSELFFKLW